MVVILTQEKVNSILST